MCVCVCVCVCFRGEGGCNKFASSLMYLAHMSVLTISTSLPSLTCGQAWPLLSSL